MSTSVSASASDACCIPSDCACDDWLSLYCDYEVVSLCYCSVVTEFVLARSKGMKMSAINPSSGVHPADKIFSLSYLENDVEMGIGGIITDADGTEWIIYAQDTVKAFCIKKLWARSVSACFCLLDSIEILDLDCEEDGCNTELVPRLLTRVQGKIVTTTASLRDRNDSQDLVYRFSGELVKWPLNTRPKSSNRLRTKQGTFRITSVRDNGPLLPYHVDLEIENAECR